MGSGDEEEPGRAERPWLPPGALSNEPLGQQYHAYTVKFDEIVEADQLCDAEELGRLRNHLDQQLCAPAGRDRQARQPPAAPPDGAAEPLLGVRPRRGHARRRAPGAHRRQPDACAVLQEGEGHQLPRHRGVAADRQFGLDARPADHGGGDERRHPGPHARALRRQGRDPGLHHARLEGRPEPRAVARRRQARQSRAASTTCATSSTSRPTRRGGARARTSA